MDLKREASRCRQRITGCLSELQHLAGFCLGHFPLVRGSLYTYRRRCGKAGCRCARGELHRGQALGVRAGGRSRLVPIGGIDRQALSEHVAAYRQVRRARAELVRTFGELLAVADRLDSAPAGDSRRPVAPPGHPRGMSLFREGLRAAAAKAAQSTADQMVVSEEQMLRQTLTELETFLVEEARKFARALLEKRLELDPRTDKDREYPCARCGGRLRIQEEAQPRRLPTVFGEVEYRRPYGVCDRCGINYAPLDSRRTTRS